MNQPDESLGKYISLAFVSAFFAAILALIFSAMGDQGSSGFIIIFLVLTVTLMIGALVVGRIQREGQRKALRKLRENHIKAAQGKGWQLRPHCHHVAYDVQLVRHTSLSPCMGFQIDFVRHQYARFEIDAQRDLRTRTSEAFSLIIEKSQQSLPWAQEAEWRLQRVESPTRREIIQSSIRQNFVLNAQSVERSLPQIKSFPKDCNPQSPEALVHFAQEIAQMLTVVAALCLEDEPFLDWLCGEFEEGGAAYPDWIFVPFAQTAFTHFMASPQTLRLAQRAQGHADPELRRYVALYHASSTERWQTYHDLRAPQTLRATALYLALRDDLSPEQIEGVAERLYQVPLLPEFALLVYNMLSERPQQKYVPLLAGLLNQSAQLSRALTLSVVDLLVMLGHPPWAQLNCLASPLPVLRRRSIKGLLEERGEQWVFQCAISHLERILEPRSIDRQPLPGLLQCVALYEILGQYTPITELSRVRSLVEQLNGDLLYRGAKVEAQALLQRILARSPEGLHGALQLSEADGGELSIAAAGGELSALPSETK